MMQTEENRFPRSYLPPLVVKLLHMGYSNVNPIIFGATIYLQAESGRMDNTMAG